MKILDHLSEPDDLVVLTSLVFFILILVTPVFTLAQVQYESTSAVVFLSILMIVTDLILVYLWKYINKRSLSVDRGKREVKSIHNIFYVIITLHTLSILLAYYNVKLSIILPVVMIPTLILLNSIFNKNDG